MSTRTYDVLRLGNSHRFKTARDSHQGLIAVIVLLFTPALMLVHLPVSLLLAGTPQESLYAGITLGVLVIMFAGLGANMAPPTAELQWLLQCISLRRALFQLCRLNLRNNLLYWAMWIAPFIAFYHAGESLDLGAYSAWLLLYTLSYTLLLLGLLLFRYREILPASGIPHALFRRIYRLRTNTLLTPLGFAIATSALLGLPEFIVLRVLLMIVGTMLAAHGINSKFSSAAEIRFWMHVRSCSAVQLVLRYGSYGIAAALLLIIPAAWHTGTAPLFYGAVFLTASLALCPLTLHPIGRVLVLPGFATIAGGLMVLQFL